LDAAERPALATATLNGMRKGFIDLVFEHDGRYFVADYKSNWLGPDAAAYTTDAMRDAILHARYELQYVLYLLALHRLLKARLPDYDYDRHVGGAVYLFLRGSGAEPGCTEPRRADQALDRLLAAPCRHEHLITRWAARAWLRPLDAAFAGPPARGARGESWLILAAPPAISSGGHLPRPRRRARRSGFALSLPPEARARATSRG
jgi:hypothetical protein